MKFEKFIGAVYLTGAVLVALGLIRMEIIANEYSVAIQQLNKETAQLESRVEQLQQQLFEFQK